MSGPLSSRLLLLGRGRAQLSSDSLDAGMQLLVTAGSEEQQHDDDMSGEAKDEASHTPQLPAPPEQQQRGGSSIGSTAATGAARSLPALAALLARPAGLHGRVNKAGVPAVFDKGFGLYGYTDREVDRSPPPEIKEWAERVKSYNLSVGISVSKARDPAAVERLRSPAPSCLYMVDHKYKAIYARITKTAGTSLSRMLGFIPSAIFPERCQRNTTYCFQECVGRPMCLNRSVLVSELEPLWESYTVFGVVRNPWVRAVSSWAYNTKRYLANTSCIDTFQRFAALPSAYVQRCMHEKQAFWRMALNHIEPQWECLFTKDGRPAVDYIARTEMLDEDLQDLVKLLNERRPEGRPEIPASDISEANTNIAAGDDGSPEARVTKYAVSYLNGTALEDIRMYFEKDLHLLQFDTSLPPTATAAEQ